MKVGGRKENQLKNHTDVLMILGWNGFRILQIDYLDEWKKSVKSRNGYSDKQKQSMLLSPETLLGIKIIGEF